MIAPCSHTKSARSRVHHCHRAAWSWRENEPAIFPSFRLDTIDGTATAGEDYVKLSEEFRMEPGQQEKKITIHVIDDNQWEPDETFFVKLSLPEGQEGHAKLGSKTVALVTIINDDGRPLFARA